MKIRIDKFLADSGFGTRSKVRSLIGSGSVLVNGIVEKDHGRRVDTESDQIVCGGVSIGYSEFEYYMLNKPAGIITASRDKNEKTVVDLIESKKRRDLSPVGRLDRDTEGLLLITNDGKLAHDLLAPGKHVDKVYMAYISGTLPEDVVEHFRKGVDIGDDKLTKPADLVIGEVISAAELDEEGFDTSEVEWNQVTEIEITLTEGRYHEIKRMFEAVDCQVEYLKRLSMGTLLLDEDLEPGEYRSLTEAEIKSLKKS